MTTSEANQSWRAIQQQALLIGSSAMKGKMPPRRVADEHCPTGSRRRHDAVAVRLLPSAGVRQFTCPCHVLAERALAREVSHKSPFIQAPEKMSTLQYIADTTLITALSGHPYVVR